MCYIVIKCEYFHILVSYYFHLIPSSMHHVVIGCEECYLLVTLIYHLITWSMCHATIGCEECQISTILVATSSSPPYVKLSLDVKKD